MPTGVVLGRYDSGDTVDLPEGDDGDRLVAFLMTNPNPGAFSGWSFLSPAASGGGTRIRAYHKLRAGGETTVTLPTISGGTSPARHYAIFNIEDGATYVPTFFDGNVYAPGSVQFFNPNAHYRVTPPRYAVAVLYSNLLVYSEGGGNTFALYDEYHDSAGVGSVVATRAYSGVAGGGPDYEMFANVNTDTNPSGACGWGAVVFGTIIVPGHDGIYTGEIIIGARADDPGEG